MCSYLDKQHIQITLLYDIVSFFGKWIIDHRDLLNDQLDEIEPSMYSCCSRSVTGDSAQYIQLLFQLLSLLS